jgi:hypothetical protein
VRISPPTTGPVRCGQSDRGAKDAERLAPFGSLEQFLDQAGVLRQEHAAGDALQQPCGDEETNGRCRTGERARQDERCQGDQEHPPPAQCVAESACRYQRQSEAEGVAGYHPLRCSGRHAEPSLDGRQRHVDDADVEQRHERGELAHGQRPPAQRVAGRTGSVRRGPDGCHPIACR